MSPEFVVVGQIARDLVVRIPELPGPGGTSEVAGRREMLGGKGANQAVALAQLGASVALVGVVGTDEVGDALVAQAAADGIDTSWVLRRAGADSGLVLDVLVGDEPYRYLEDLPEPVRLRPDDVLGAASALSRAGVVLLQMQQRPAALVLAARIARDGGARVHLDGNPPDPALPGLADVWRMDAKEAALHLGRTVAGADQAGAAARELLGRGPGLVVVEAGADGNVLAWEGGEVTVPLVGGRPVDTTGGGDAFCAVLALELARGRDPETAGRAATAAAGDVVARPGGRPALSLSPLEGSMSANGSGGGNAGQPR